jgi:cystinosin
MNVTGFTFYSFYCSYGYFFPEGRKSTGTVDLNDLLFAYHAIFITLLTAIQACIYPRGQNRIMKKTIVYLIAMWVFCIFYGAL